MRVQMFSRLKPFLLIILFVGLTSLPSVSVLACEVKCCDLLPGETNKRERAVAGDGSRDSDTELR